MAKNIDDLMKQYEELLGVDIGDLDDQIQVELDPETLALQKQLEKMQKQQELQINQAQQKQQAKPQKDDDLDQMLNQYSNPGQKQQQQQIQQEQIQLPKPQPKPAKPQIDMGATEALVMDLNKLNSLNALQSEIKYLQQLITQARGNKSIIDVLNNSIKQCQQHLEKIKQKIKEGAIQAQQYLQQITQSMKDQQQLFVQNQNNQLLKLRLATRVQTLQEEYKSLSQSLRNFDKITQQFGCGEDPAFKMMVEEIDGKPFNLKIKELLRRHKQYFNFASYLSQYMKQEKEDLLNRIIKSLEQSKQLQNELKNGNNIPIAKFCLSEFPELNEDVFKGCNRIEYQQTVTQMIEATQNAIKEEQAYMKIAMKAKPVLQKVQGQKSLIAVSPVDACKQNLQRYELMLKYFDDILKQPWFPIPVFQTINEQRTLSMENRDVPNNTLRVQFKKLSKGGKYYINYSIDLNGFIVGKTEQTNQDGILNYSRDIPLDKSIKSLIGKSFELKLYEKGIFSDSQKGAVLIKLDDLMEFSVIEGDAQFNGYSLNYAILLRESFNKKKTILTVNVLKMYPQFKVNEGLEEYVESKILEYPDVGKASAIQEEKVIAPQQIQEEVEQEESLVDKTQLVCLIHQDTDPEFLKVQEYAMQNKNTDVLNPEDPKLSPVFYFIKPYEGFLKDKKTEFKTQPSMRTQYKFIDQLWQDYYRQTLLLNKQIEDEDYEKYGQNLEKSIVRDQQLIKIYQSLNVQTWLKFVKVRLEVAQKELEALKEQLQ